MLRRLRRRFRLLSFLPMAMWAWRERYVLSGMAGFARTIPDRVKLGRREEVWLAAKVHWALLREPGLRGGQVRLGAIQGADVILEMGRGSERFGRLAREVIEGVPGVSSVRVEDANAVAAPNVVAGAGEVSDLQDGKVGDDDVPVRL